MWVRVQPKESGEEPSAFALRKVLRHSGWDSLVFCNTRQEAEELASSIRQEGFSVSVTEPIRTYLTRRKSKSTKSQPREE